jgi:hypothetical protein
MTAGKASQPFKVLRMQSPYRLVKVEAGPETADHEITYRSCGGGPLSPLF